MDGSLDRLDLGVLIPFDQRVVMAIENVDDGAGQLSHLSVHLSPTTYIDAIFVIAEALAECFFDVVLKDELSVHHQAGVPGVFDPFSFARSGTNRDLLPV